MGDRGNILVKQKSDGDAITIYLYSHYGGSNLPILLKNVLSKKLNWDDDSYLARMIFSAMIRDDIDSDKYYGISTSPGDNSYPYLVVDPEKQTVSISNEDAWFIPVRSLSFSDYIKLSDKETIAFRGGSSSEEDDED